MPQNVNKIVIGNNNFVIYVSNGIDKDNRIEETNAIDIKMDVRTNITIVS